MSLNIELLEQSFSKIKPHAEEFVVSFYDNLFIAHPEVKPMFAETNMAKQQKQLLAALVFVINNLREPEVLGKTLEEMGARHAVYGTLPKHYPAVGAALLTTFEQYFQSDWTPAVKQAWTEAFEAIAALMLQGAAKTSSSAQDKSPQA